MALVETSTFCHQHAWVGKVGKKCPKCKLAAETKKNAEAIRWKGLTTEEKLLELKRRVERLETEPHPDQRIF